jgi:hypothetical protein
LGDDNVINFRKPPPPPAPKKPKRPLRLPPWAIVIAAALALGAVTYVMDQQKTGANPPRVAGP